MRVEHVLLVGALSCLSLVACQKPAKPPQPEVRARIDLTKGHPPKADCVNANRPMDAITIKITDVAKLKATQWHSSTEGQGNKPTGPETKVPPIPPPYTELDVNGMPYLQKHNDIMLLKLQLEQPGYTFAPGSDTILTDAQNGRMFCVKNAAPTPSNSNEVIFYVHYLDSAAHGVIGAYTFSYVTPTGQLSRVTVDPDVSNDG